MHEPSPDGASFSAQALSVRQLNLPMAPKCPASGMVSFGVTTVLFATMYKYVPDVRIEWRDVWIGAVATSALFTLGKFAIGLYLGRSSVASAYGAAGSLVIILVWVYYSAQILLFGAE